MNTIQLTGFISEGLTTFVGIFLMIYIIRKDPKYLANVFMGIALGSIGGYTGFIFIYDIIAQPWAIYLFFPLALSVLLFGGMLLYFSMNVITDSTQWIEDKKKWVPYFIIWLVYSIYIFDPRLITIEQAETVKTKFDLIALSIIVLLLLFFLVKTVFVIKKVGLNASKGPSKERMKWFLIGIYTYIISIFVNIPAHIFDGMVFLVIVFFYILLLGEVIMAYAFLKKF